MGSGIHENVTNCYGVLWEAGGGGTFFFVVKIENEKCDFVHERIGFVWRFYFEKVYERRRLRTGKYDFVHESNKSYTKVTFVNIVGSISDNMVVNVPITEEGKFVKIV